MGLTEKDLKSIFQHLGIIDILCCKLVCKSWSNVLKVSVKPHLRDLLQISSMDRFKCVSEFFPIWPLQYVANSFLDQKKYNMYCGALFFYCKKNKVETQATILWRYLTTIHDQLKTCIGIISEPIMDCFLTQYVRCITNTYDKKYWYQKLCENCEIDEKAYLLLVKYAKTDIEILHYLQSRIPQSEEENERERQLAHTLYESQNKKLKC